MKKIILSILANLINFLVIYFVYFSVVIVFKNVDVRYIVLFFLVMSTYIIPLITQKSNFGMILLNLKYSSKSKLRIFIADTLNLGIFFMIPLLILKIFISNLMVILIFICCWIIFLLANIICYRVCKKSLTEKITKTEIDFLNPDFGLKKKIRHLLSFIFDFSLIFCLSIIIDRILIGYIYVSNMYILIFVFFFYNLLFSLFLKNTPGKILFNISVITSENHKIKIFFREFLKIIILFILPYIIIQPANYAIYATSFFLSEFMLILFINFVIVLNLYYIFGTFTWNLITKSSIRKNLITKKLKLITIASTFCFLLLGYSALLFFNNNNNPSERQILGFNFPFKFKEYPNTSEITSYYNFLKDNDLKSPKEYILDLFDDYDIVVLCENIHGEDTQWDMIYEVVSDERFINNVGHIFTEYGDVENQSKVDKFLNTVYDNDTTLNKEIAKLGRIMTGSFHFFLQKINKLNATLSTELKIKEHFTDIGFDCYFKGKENIPIELLHNRDSLMASVVIGWYKENKGKCLVVTNYRHAFAVNNAFKVNNKNWYELLKTNNLLNNEAQYIYESFPEKTANILIDPATIIYFPIHKGKWTKAFSLNGNKSVGFDLNNTPFGNDRFDMFPFRKKFDITFKDIFHGFVFYVPKNEYKTSNKLYQKYGAEEEFRTLNISENDPLYSKYLAKIDYYKNDTERKQELLAKTKLFYVYLYNYIDIFCYCVLSTGLLILLIWSGVSMLFKGRSR